MKKFVIHGILASLALAAVYLVIVSIAQGFTHAVGQFVSIWYLMLPLIAGFGVQVGLFSYTHHFVKASAKGVATSGGVSTVSMVACCAHHLTDVLPFIGLTTAAIFLTQYQNFFIVLGILSNIVGILFMLNIIQNKKLYHKRSFFGGAFMYDMKKLRNIMVLISIPILAIVFLISISTPQFITGQSTAQSYRELALSEKTNSGNGLTISAMPQNFRFGEPVRFGIKFDTHQGSLDFDVTEVSSLETNGNVYNAISWDGAAAGGHHREGILTFPTIDNASSMTLKIRGVYGITERSFEWNLE